MLFSPFSIFLFFNWIHWSHGLSNGFVCSMEHHIPTPCMLCFDWMMREKEYVETGNSHDGCRKSVPRGLSFIMLHLETPKVDWWAGCSFFFRSSSLHLNRKLFNILCIRLRFSPSEDGILSWIRAQSMRFHSKIVYLFRYRSGCM